MSDKRRQSTTISPDSSPSASLLEKLGASQNMPALLNDPRKGKQKDFFTRSWGDSFTELTPIPPSPYVCELPPKCFDRYLRKLRRYRRHDAGSGSTTGIQTDEDTSDSPFKFLDATSNFQRISANVSRVFLDSNFDITKPETFASIYHISKDGNFSQQVQSEGRLVQENLTHQLDMVEVSIANQVAQKSQNFFQVMTYHNALMTQLKSLVKLVRSLRSNLLLVDESNLKPSLELCRLKRRLENATNVINKLSYMLVLSQTQPTIQVHLSSSDFTGALDLIATSRDFMNSELQGTVSFQYTGNQFDEIEKAIDSMLLKEFTTFITAHIEEDFALVKITTLNEDIESVNVSCDSDHLKSVVLGLIRQHSFDFLEHLESIGINAGKRNIMEACVSVICPNVTSTLINSVNIVTDFAKKASCTSWIDLFDVLMGSSTILIRKIYFVYSIINDAINDLYDNDSKEGDPSVNTIPKEKLDSLKSINHERFENICEDIHERCGKLLNCRSKPSSANLIKTEELTSMGMLVSLFCEHTKKLAGKSSQNLQLSLQSQSVMYTRAFHDTHTLAMSNKLDTETWKSCQLDFTNIIVRLNAIPSMTALFEVNDDEIPISSVNGIKNGKSHLSSELGHCVIGNEKFAVVESIGEFLKLLAEFCNLCSMLPNVSLDLGCRTVDFIKSLNSRICQLLIGAGAIHVSGLKTITVRNLALGLRSLELVARIIPYVLIHFQSCYSEKSVSPVVNGASPGITKAETKQLDILQKQFDQALRQVKDHIEEIHSKITSVTAHPLNQYIKQWTPSKKIPSENFKRLFKHLHRLHHSTQDIWQQYRVEKLFREVHNNFLVTVQQEIKAKNINFDSESARMLQSELTFYAQSMKQLGVLPVHELNQEKFEMMWRDDFCDSDDTSM